MSNEQKSGDKSAQQSCDAPGKCGCNGAGACHEEKAAQASGVAADGAVDAKGDLEKKSLEERLLRAYAEFDNFRKRCDAQREEERARAEENLVEGLLPVLDEFDAAINSLEEGEHKRGVEMVRGNFWKVLSSHGLKAMECVGKKFDSDMHEAAKSVEAKGEKEDGIVVEELRKGFEFNGKILRHPLVVVAKKQ